MSHWGDLNSRPPDYESGALPTKLQWRQRDHLRHRDKRIGAVDKAKFQHGQHDSMEETDEGAAPEGSTLSGTPNAAPAGDDSGAYGQPEVQYAKRSAVPVIIGAIYSLFQVLAVLASLAVVLGGALLSSFASEVGEGAAEAGILVTVVGVIMLAISCVGVYAGVLMIQYKKKGIHIALGLLAVGVVMELIMNVALELPVTDGFAGSLATSGICAALVAIPLLVSSISDQME